MIKYVSDILFIPKVSKGQGQPQIVTAGALRCSRTLKFILTDLLSLYSTEYYSVVGAGTNGGTGTVVNKQYVSLAKRSNIVMVQGDSLPQQLKA